MVDYFIKGKPEGLHSTDKKLDEKEKEFILKREKKNSFKADGVGNTQLGKLSDNNSQLIKRIKQMFITEYQLNYTNQL